MGQRMMSAGESLPDVMNLCRAQRLFAVLPAAERYRLLKDWVLPNRPGEKVRAAMCFAPGEAPAEFFFSGGRVADPNGSTVNGQGLSAYGDGVISFVEMLVEDAAAAGKLQALSAAADEAAKDSNMAGTLLVLVSFRPKLPATSNLRLTRSSRSGRATCPRSASTGRCHGRPI